MESSSGLSYELQELGPSTPLEGPPCCTQARPACPEGSFPLSAPPQSQPLVFFSNLRTTDQPGNLSTPQWTPQELLLNRLYLINLWTWGGWPYPAAGTCPPPCLSQCPVLSSRTQQHPPFSPDQVSEAMPGLCLRAHCRRY